MLWLARHATPSYACLTRTGSCYFTQLRPSARLLTSKPFQLWHYSSSPVFEQTAKSHRRPRPKPTAAADETERKDYLPILLAKLHDSFHLRSFLFTTLNLFLLGHLVLNYVFYVSPTAGPSMLPTINNHGDWVLVSRLHRRGRWIQVGDLISYDHPIRQGVKGIKRIVGMPGDFVLRDTPGEGEGWMVQVPQGHCWIVGDNLDASRDSRMFGPLPLALVRGKVMGKIWPFTIFKSNLEPTEPQR